MENLNTTEHDIFLSLSDGYIKRTYSYTQRRGWGSDETKANNIIFDCFCEIGILPISVKNNETLKKYFSESLSYKNKIYPAILEDKTINEILASEIKKAYSHINNYFNKEESLKILNNPQTIGFIINKEPYITRITDIIKNNEKEIFNIVLDFKKNLEEKMIFQKKQIEVFEEKKVKNEKLLSKAIHNLNKTDDELVLFFEEQQEKNKGNNNYGYSFGKKYFIIKPTEKTKKIDPINHDYFLRETNHLLEVAMLSIGLVDPEKLHFSLSSENYFKKEYGYLKLSKNEKLKDLMHIYFYLLGINKIDNQEKELIFNPIDDKKHDITNVHQARSLLKKEILEEIISYTKTNPSIFKDVQKEIIEYRKNEKNTSGFLIKTDDGIDYETEKNNQIISEINTISLVLNHIKEKNIIPLKNQQKKINAKK